MNNRINLFLLSLILTSCASAITACSIFKGITNQEPYTIDLQETVIPPKAIKVSIEGLVSEPETYRDQYVELQGVNFGYLETPACYPYVGPPTQWGLGSETTNNPAIIKVKNDFGGIISDPSDPKTGRAIRSTMMKRVAVWGWVRLYNGGIGCASRNPSGTPQPLPEQFVWYLEAVKLQFLESVKSSHKPSAFTQSRPDI